MAITRRMMVRKDQKIHELARVGPFSACTKQELSAVAQSCTGLEVKEGFVLTKQGVPGQQCFVIASGQADVLIDGQQVATVGPGDFVGETALLDTGPRTATVVATTPMRLWVMNPREFNSVLDASTTISRKLLVSLAERLHKAETNPPPPTAHLPLGSDPDALVVVAGAEGESSAQTNAG
jgi:CRP/FNR family transcriptional regulator, cyclic AMP receptor protein